MYQLPKKTVLSGICIVLIFGAIFTFSILAACPVKQENCPNQRPPVAFPHDMHMSSFDCLDCHHVYDKAHNNILDPMELYAGNPHAKCASCHDSNHRINRQEAFHQQCIRCHLDFGRTGDAAGGPSLCGECHQTAGQTSDFVMILGEPHD